MQVPVYRQGDVLLWRVPDEAVSEIRTTGRPVIERMTPHIVLAMGEKTGHAHTIDPTEATEIIVGRSPDHRLADRYIDVTGENATIRHEEHAPVTVPTGLYKVNLQREYMPKSSAESDEPVPAPRRVID